MLKNVELLISEIAETDSRYSSQAYVFLLEALAYTQKRFKVDHHVTSQELLKGIQHLLLRQFGAMTLSVLNHWGIKSTEDFGCIVFNLVEKGVLSKTKEDDIAHFKNAFDFEQVFCVDYRRKFKRQVSRMR